jgi:hypothetical protein
MIRLPAAVDAALMPDWCFDRTLNGYEAEHHVYDVGHGA